MYKKSNAMTRKDDEKSLVDDSAMQDACESAACGDSVSSREMEQIRTQENRQR